MSVSQHAGIRILIGITFLLMLGFMPTPLQAHQQSLYLSTGYPTQAFASKWYYWHRWRTHYWWGGQFWMMKGCQTEAMQRYRSGYIELILTAKEQGKGYAQNKMSHYLFYS